jgi:hypothetical protein
MNKNYVLACVFSLTLHFGILYADEKKSDNCCEEDHSELINEVEKALNE